MIGEPGEGWALAMTTVSHEREPAELGFCARYAKTVLELEEIARRDPESVARRAEQLAWAYVQSEMLRVHTARRLSERLDGITHGPRLDRQAPDDLGRAERRARRARVRRRRAITGGSELLNTYLYSRAQSVMGGTSQIQKNIIATRILGLPAKA